MPSLDAYADRLWDYWERNLDPDLFKDRSLRGAIEGKVVVITGASSGIGHAAALKAGRGGRHRRARRPLAGQARGDQGRDRAGGRHRDRSPGRPLGPGGLRSAGRGDAGDARPRGHPGQQRRPLDPALDREPVRPLPRLRAHDAGQLLRRAEADPRLPARHAGAQVRSHHQRLVDRRADEHAALLRLRREQERARRVLALHRVGDRRGRRRDHDHLHAAGAHADDRADDDVRRTSRPSLPRRRPSWSRTR